MKLESSFHTEIIVDVEWRKNVLVNEHMPIDRYGQSYFIGMAIC